MHTTKSVMQARKNKEPENHWVVVEHLPVIIVFILPFPANNERRRRIDCMHGFRFSGIVELTASLTKLLL